MGKQHVSFNPEDNGGLPRLNDRAANDLGGILMELGNGWNAGELKEFAEILTGICKDFHNAGLEIKMSLIPKPPTIIRPADGIVMADAEGKLRVVTSEKPKEEGAPETNDPDLKDIL